MATGKLKKKCCNAAAVILPNDKTAEQLAKLAWALAHPARVRIVRVLLSQRACLCGEIVDQLPLAQSTVSQHLKILKEAGLVEGEVDGPKVCYGINRERLKELKNLIAKM